MEFVLAALVLGGIVALIVLNPLRKPDVRERLDEGRREALEAAKEAKYREIRDVELDYRMGKLSETDWREADRELRLQAMAILRELDSLGGDGIQPTANGDERG